MNIRKRAITTLGAVTLAAAAAIVPTTAAQAYNQPVGPFGSKVSCDQVRYDYARAGRAVTYCYTTNTRPGWFFDWVR